MKRKNNSRRQQYFRIHKRGNKSTKQQNAITRFNQTTFGFLNIDGITIHSLTEAKNTLECKKTHYSNDSRNKNKTRR